jgi:hypothetical protein
MDTVEEDYPNLLQRVIWGLQAGFVATLVLSLLELTRGMIPQLETIHFLDNVADATAKVMGLPVLPLAGWYWHFVIGTLWWGSWFAIMLPLLPGRGLWRKGAVFGLIAGLLVLLMVMPLAGAGYFGMQLSWLDPLITLFYHAIYGAVLGLMYGYLAQHQRSGL